MFERRSHVIAFLVVATLLTLPASTAERRFSDGFLVRAEYRREASSGPFFPGPPGTADLRRTQPTALIAVIWVFGSKKGTW